MPYQAKVLRVMIASPSDVARERQVAQEVVLEWNAVHSADKRLVLLPIAWETHSSPDMGERPQEVLNKQILRSADLLIAIFWTRLGTPTGKAASGTVEEIEEHLASGKPTMLYFSEAPVRLDSVQDDQYRALKAFKAQCFSRGLCQTYEDIAELQRTLTRQLAQTVLRAFPQDGRDTSPDEQLVGRSVDVLSQPDRPARGRLSLSKRSAQLLLAAQSDPEGVITRLEHVGGVLLSSGTSRMYDGGLGRDLADWDAALEELLGKRLIKADRTERGFYAVTAEGYRVADALKDDA